MEFPCCALTPSRAVLLLFVVSTVALFSQLGAPLQSWDESVYAESAKEMVSSGDWLTPHWDYETFFEKPPLTIWGTAILFKLFGVNEVTSRSVSAICGVACVLILFVIGRTFLSDYRAFLGSLILLFSPGFFYLATFGIMDVPLVCFALLAMYSYLRAKEAPRWWLFVGIALGLAVMAKGAAAAPAFAAISLASLIERRRPWSVWHFWIGCALFVAVAAPWHMAMMMLHGRKFFDIYIGTHVLARATSHIQNQNQAEGFSFYPMTLAAGFSPYTPLLIFCIFRKRFAAVPLVMLLLAAVTFGLFSAVTTKYPSYVFPLLPVLALLVAAGKRLSPWFFGALLVVGFFLSLHMVSLGHPDDDRSLALQARQSAGALSVGLEHGPAILFYSGRKVCDESELWRAEMTRCEGKPTSQIITIGQKLVYQDLSR